VHSGRDKAKIFVFYLHAFSVHSGCMQRYWEVWCQECQPLDFENGQR